MVPLQLPWSTAGTAAHDCRLTEGPARGTVAELTWQLLHLRSLLLFFFTSFSVNVELWLDSIQL